ncbi:MAG TPA: hypothetical protein VKG26_13365 [Bacteroidia bacterium]|nr:hypothetical protein [Bacteroidia bacterium]
MPSSYLIYHPERKVAEVGKYKVHHDMFGGNEDPYILNKQFLHTYCNITQLSNNEGTYRYGFNGKVKKSLK